MGVGMTLASTTRRPLTPFTRNSLSTTFPIEAVPEGCWIDLREPLAQLTRIFYLGTYKVACLTRASICSSVEVVVIGFKPSGTTSSVTIS